MKTKCANCGFEQKVKQMKYKCEKCGTINEIGQIIIKEAKSK